MFVVPSEAIERLAERCTTGRNFDQQILRRGTGACSGRLRIIRTLLVRFRQTVQQVSKGFGMHVPVFDCHLENPGVDVLEMRIDPGTRLSGIAVDLSADWPV